MVKKVIRAFTLVEMVIVIAVIAILSAVLIPVFGNVIEDSKVNADRQEVSVMNFALSTYKANNKILSETDVKRVINSVYGESSYDSLQPKSAQYGYHYWYDIKKNEIVLAKTSEILGEGEVQNISLNTYQDDAVYGKGGVIDSVLNPGGSTIEFEVNNVRTKFVKGYFFLDKQGSPLADVLTSCENILSGKTQNHDSEYKRIIDSVYKLSEGDATDVAVQEPLLNFFKSTAIVTDDCTMRFSNVEEVRNLLFAENITTISSSIHVYTYVDELNEGVVNTVLSDGSAQNSIMTVEGEVEIAFPSTIKTVCENSLIFNVKDLSKVTLNTLLTSVNELVSTFKAYSTNADIYVLGLKRSYQISGTKLLYEGVALGRIELGFSNEVTNFDLSVDAVENKVVVAGNKVYVAADYNSAIKINSQNFTFKNASQSGISQLVFSSDNEQIASVNENGEFTVEMPEIGGTSVATITAKTVTGSFYKQIEVNVVRIVNATFNLGAYQLNMIDGIDHEIRVDYDGSQNEFEFSSFAHSLNYSGNLAITCDSSFSAVTVGNLFEISGDKLILKQFDGEQEFTVTIANYLEKTFKLVLNDISASEFERKFKYTDSYLYRLGNANEIKIGSLFSSEKAGKSVSITVYDVAKNNVGKPAGEIDQSGEGFRAVYQKELNEGWADATLRFYGEGVAVIRITNGAGYTDLNVEVVNATNVTEYSQLKNQNSVLLNDIVMTSGGSYALSNARLYGNGFKFDVTGGNVNGKNLSSNYLVSISNAVLDNVVITGAVYTKYGFTVSEQYNNALVLSSGDSVIANCMLSNCAAPVRVRDGNLKIINTTLKGGFFANLDIRNGFVTLEDVTTINQASANDKSASGSTPVGLGIVFYYENVLSTASLVVKGELSQYNHISETDADNLNKGVGQGLLKDPINQMFGSSLSKFQYTDSNGEKWINAGILKMSTNGVVDLSSSENAKSYGSSSVSFGSKDENKGYLYSPLSAAPQNPEQYSPSKQYPKLPNVSVDTEKNYFAKEEDSNKSSYYDSNVSKFMVSFDAGDSFTWDTSILTVEKYGVNFVYSVTVNGESFSGSEIVFDQSGEYEIVYTYVDLLNYNADLSTYSVTYTKKIEVSVTAIKATAKNADFKLGGKETEVITVGNTNYLSIKGGTASGVVEKTIDGQPIYYPQVEMIMSDGKTSHSSAWNAYFPVFSGVIEIIDYANGDPDSPLTYNASTTSMPEALKVNGDPTSIFKYQSSSSAGATPVVKNNILVYSSPSISVKRSEYTTDVQYVYTDGLGSIYVYVVRYHAVAQSYSNSCFTSDTLITLADGSQKRIDQLEFTDEILTWDFMSGEYAKQDIAILVNHGKSLYNVVNLTFSNGEVLKIIGEHGVFDYDENRFVYLDMFNAREHIGHRFVSYNGNGGYDIVTLSNVEITEECTEAWSITSAHNSNALASGMLTVAPPADFYNWIAMGDKLLYDREQFEMDVEKYGLYTYEQFKDYVTYEQFVNWGGAYLKIAVEKGAFTFEYIVELIELYSEWMA